MLTIQVTNKNQRAQFEHADGPIEFGRGYLSHASSIPRFRIEDQCVSRDQFLVEALPGDRIRIENRSTRTPATLADGGLVAPGSQRELDLPVTVTVGQTTIEIRPGSAPAMAEVETRPVPVPRPGPDTAPGWPQKPEAGDVRAESLPSLAAFARPADLLRQRPLVDESGELPSAATMAQWLETVLRLQQGAATPGEFYQETAQSLVSLIGLDLGLVLLRQDDAWAVAGSSAAGDQVTVRFSHTILNRVITERVTVYQDLTTLKDKATSLRDIEAVVASPVVGMEGTVVAALYGIRTRSVLARGGIRPLEAQLVQLLAAATAAHLTRTAALRTRIQFEQFFSPELVQQLERDPRLLDGRDQEVTVLFSDLRGFTALSERLGAHDTCRMVRDIMERLSECIVASGGVIVDYAGDGIMAMWNAPTPQADHAARAGGAALTMLAALPELNARWRTLADGGLALGIGINTGPALVGNTGSSRKFKYGPHGHTINLASRVQDATKKLGLPLLITAPTRTLLPPALATRRLGRVRLPGVAEPIVLYELHGESPSAEWLAHRAAYETALDFYEAGQWSRACQTLMPLLDLAERADQHDAPTLKLMRRAWECLEARPQPFDPVLEVASK
jgi:adenylate cyclase